MTLNPYAPPSVGGSVPLPPPSAAPIAGTFHSPLIGATQAPAGLTGEGTITLSIEGLLIEARRMSTGLIGALGLIGLLVGAVAGIYVAAILKIEKPTVLIMVMIGGFIFAGAYAGKVLGGRKIFRGLMRYEHCSATALRGSKLTFIHTAEPKGAVDFTARPDMAQALYAHFGQYAK